jgi:predicted small lipoprotein YifL
MLRPVFVGVPLAFRRPIILLGMTAVAAMSLSACGRNGALELPPGPASIQPAPAALSWPPPGPVAADTSGAGPTQQDTIARTGFDVHGNPAATPGQKKPFFLDPLLH